MQQTEKYKLNLIESSDPFLPDALNTNTQKIEAAMLAHEAAVQAETVILEGKMLKFAYGAAERGSGEENITVHLPFKPKAVLVDGPVGDMGEGVYLGVEGSTLTSAYSVKLLENSFKTSIAGPIYYAAFG